MACFSSIGLSKALWASAEAPLGPAFAFFILGFRSPLTIRFWVSREERDGAMSMSRRNRARHR